MKDYIAVYNVIYLVPIKWDRGISPHSISGRDAIKQPSCFPYLDKQTNERPIWKILFKGKEIYWQKGNNNICVAYLKQTY